MTYLRQISQDRSTLDRALDIARKAVARDDTFWGHQFGLSLVYLYQKQREKSLAEAEAGAARFPDNADMQALLAVVHLSMGKSDECMKHIEEAMAHMPDGPNWYLGVLANVHGSTGHLKEAVDAYRTVIAKEHSHSDAFDAHLNLAILYMELGQEEKAKAAAREILRLEPDFSVEVWGHRNPVLEQQQIENKMATLRKAGLK